MLLSGRGVISKVVAREAAMIGRVFSTRGSGEDEMGGGGEQGPSWVRQTFYLILMYHRRTTFGQLFSTSSVLTLILPSSSPKDVRIFSSVLKHLSLRVDQVVDVEPIGSRTFASYRIAYLQGPRSPAPLPTLTSKGFRWVPLLT